MGRIVIGTSGYSYRDWVGPFYPEQTKEREFLEYYAKTFNYVELNFSYYSMPAKSLVADMVKRTPEQFLFGIKAHKSLTHEIDSAGVEDAAGKFKLGVEPLAESGKLGAVLFQFPYSFHYTPENRTYIDSLLKQYADYPAVVEFRNSEWLGEQVFAALAARNVGLVSVDEPDLPKLLRPTERVTSSVGYVRFHGRNKASWWTGSNVSRYDYLYTEDELAEWIPRLERMAEAARILIIAFNNHFTGQAVKNAVQIKGILTTHGFEDVI
jgi:uncharacterized protein YecE (DUF72 family)